jgi:hypothetical protein
MTSSLKTSLLCAALMFAAPAFAQADDHAGHNPATPPVAAPAPVDPAKAMPPMTMAAPPATDAPQGHAAMSGGMAGGMGGGMMSPEMMKECMRHMHQQHRTARHRHHD